MSAKDIERPAEALIDSGYASSLRAGFGEIGKEVTAEEAVRAVLQALRDWDDDTWPFVTREWVAGIDHLLSE